MLYTHNHSHNNDFNERTNTLLYKNISLTLYSRKGWCWLCVRGELETGTDCCKLTQDLLTIAALLSHLDWGCSTVGHWGPCGPQSTSCSHTGILSPTGSNWPKPSVSWFDVHLLPLSFRLFTQVHPLIDGSVEGQYVTFFLSVLNYFVASTRKKKITSEWV